MRISPGVWDKQEFYFNDKPIACGQLSPKEIDAFMRGVGRDWAVRNMRSFLKLAHDHELPLEQRAPWVQAAELRRRIIAVRDFMGWEYADLHPERVQELLEITP